MSAIPKYLFVIKDSSGNQYEFEKSTQRAWEWYENDIGRCRFLIPYNDLKLSASSVSDSAFSEILIYRDGVLVWQGLLQIIQDTKDGTWIYGETFMAALAWYGVRYNQAYTDEDIATIVGTEYDDIAIRSDNFLSGKITKGTIEAPYQTSTTTDLTITRTLFSDVFFSFLREMVAVSRGEMTSAWNQNTVFNISFSATAPTFTLLRNVGSDKEDVVFELDSEIVDFNVVRNIRDIKNYVKGYAVKLGPLVINSIKENVASRVAWYRREVYPFYSNVTDEDALAQVVDNFALDFKDPYKQLSIKFASGLTPFDGYSMGDNVRIRINRGRVSIDELLRVVGMEVLIDDTGIEQTKPILRSNRS